MRTADFIKAHRKQEKWNQDEGACVLLSYGVAAFPHTGKLPQEYMEAYCSEYGHELIYLGQAEQMVAKKWNVDAGQARRSGYEHLWHLHENATEPIFQDARSKFRLTLVAGPNAHQAIEQELRRNPQQTAVLALHDQAGSAHSVAVTYDASAGGGFVISDPNATSVVGPFPTFPVITDEAAHVPMGIGEGLLLGG